jgi:hypothetical protein
MNKVLIDKFIPLGAEVIEGYLRNVRGIKSWALSSAPSYDNAICN